MSNSQSEPSNDLFAKALDMAALVGYQTGSVVSRTIVHKKTGTVTLFAFDDGQALSEHTTPYDALVFMLEGEAEITIAGKSIRAKKGEMVLMPANTPHGLRALGQYKMLLTMIQS